MTAAPPVSVCLLAYNRGRLLPRTLESILAQSFTDYELIISDDHSSDDTEDICRRYEKYDRRIRYLRNPRNLGMPGNLNSALAASRGQYVANLHDGDIYRKDLLLRWKQALDAYPSAGFVFNAYRSYDPHGREIIYREKCPQIIDGRKLARRLLSKWGSSVFGTVMARRTVYHELGWFDPRFGNYSDVDMWIRISLKHDVAYVPETLMYLMPPDPTRFYAFTHWRVVLWLMGIHAQNLERYRRLDPEGSEPLMRQYPRRKLVYLVRSMLSCLKHRRWDRVREGLVIWRDCDVIWLRALGKLLGRPGDEPEWYRAEDWNLTVLHGGGYRTAAV